jgi:6-phospho-beta-glucosidase
MGVKIAVVGGGSTYTPELIDGLAARESKVPVDELALLDIEPERLGRRRFRGGCSLTTRLARRLVIATTDRDAALDGADFCRDPAGSEARRPASGTRRIPPRSAASARDDRPGGFSRGAPDRAGAVLELAEAAALAAAPGAWLSRFHEPGRIVTQALLDAGHRAASACATWRRRVPAHVRRAVRGRPVADRARARRLNHLSWLRRSGSMASTARRTSSPTTRPSLADEVGLPVELIVALGALPSYYLRTTTSPRRSSPSSVAATPGPRR